MKDNYTQNLKNTFMPFKDLNKRERKKSKLNYKIYNICYFYVFLSSSCDCLKCLFALRGRWKIHQKKFKPGISAPETWSNGLNHAHCPGLINLKKNYVSSHKRDLIVDKLLMITIIETNNRNFYSHLIKLCF